MPITRQAQRVLPVRAFGRQTLLQAALCAALIALAGPAGAQNNLPAAPPEVSFTINRFVLSGDNPLGEARAQEVLRPYLGPQSGLDKLQQATGALERALQEAGFGLYRAVLPPQETVDAIRIQIEPIRMAAVKISGNKFFDSANLRAAVPGLRENESPNMREIARQLVIANESNARNLVLRLAESANGAGVDGNLEVTDRKFWNAFVQVTNNGTSDTGQSRVVGVLQHHNLFNLDHLGSVAYTTSADRPRDVSQYGLYYRVPFYGLGGMLAGNYSYSSVSSGALGSGQEITGRGTTMGLTYTHYFHPAGLYRSNAALSFEDKLFRAPEIGGIVLPTGDVRSRPVSLDYSGRYDPDWGTLNVSGTFARNTSAGRNNDDVSYASNRAGADASWQAWRFSYGLVARLAGGWAVNVNGRAQHASEPLIGGEQFGVGGATSVRGFGERAVTGDSGRSLTVEAWSPEWIKDVRVIGFMDHGTVSRRQPVPGVTASETIASVGVGLRYTLEQMGSIALDVAHVVQGSVAPVVTRGSTRVHANVTMRF